MPHYEYRCSKGHDFSDFMFKYDEPGKCPECGEIVKKHLMSTMANTTMISGTERKPTNRSAIKKVIYPKA